MRAPEKTMSLDTQILGCHKHLLKHTKPALGYSGGDVKKWQAALRRKLNRLLGSLPAPARPLMVRRLWSRRHSLGTIEKILIRSEDRYMFPAYVCLPQGAPRPFRFVICLQGHSTGMHKSIAVSWEREDLPEAADGDRDFAIGCLQRGLAALCIEQRAFGETSQNSNRTPSCQLPAMQALMLGRTLLAERIHDVRCGLEYLKIRGDVDLDRVAIMGNSGGGTTALFAAALLPQIAMAMPSSSFCTFQDSILSLSHCVCNYVPALSRYAEMADIAGLIAPRPLVVVHGSEDPIFPLRGTQKAYRDVRRIYQASQAASRCHLIVANGGHRFYADEAWPVLQTYLD